ncbi:hypothetical protein CMV_002552 [Castanea mollissima]|uniref:Uncharacterized protein n=1 Tax=Castanea mollissima TaxID=60419 RepID=A0A8J4VXG0_9ROSI|nr:hypothetical protein CMV_002552 [Castanea mollissima]
MLRSLRRGPVYAMQAKVNMQGLTNLRPAVEGGWSESSLDFKIKCKNCEERTALITFMRQLSPPALISNRNITLLYLAIDGMAPIDGPLEFDFPLIANTMDTFTKYSDTNRQSMDPVFYGVASSAANSAYGAAQEALVEAALKARNMGFHCVLFLSNRFSNFE